MAITILSYGLPVPQPLPWNAMSSWARPAWELAGTLGFFFTERPLTANGNLEGSLQAERIIVHFNALHCKSTVSNAEKFCMAVFNTFQIHYIKLQCSEIHYSAVWEGATAQEMINWFTSSLSTASPNNCPRRYWQNWNGMKWFIDLRYNQIISTNNPERLDDNYH